jgi:hypothetical protein
MTITPGNLVQGPATLYWGAFGAAEPADSAVGTDPGVAWTDVGGTTGGVTFEVDTTYADLTVDQLIDPVGARLTKRAITLSTKLSELTMSNLNLAMNSLATITPGTGFTAMDPQTTTSATQPTYSALLLDGWAPALAAGGAARRRVIVRKVLSAAKITLTYDMTNQAVYELTWTAYFVSPSIPPFHIIDQTA